MPTLGFRGMRNKLAQKVSTKLSEKIGKEDFLNQLKEQWKPYVKKGSDIDEEVRKARERIDRSDFKGAFDKVGIMDEDLRRILTEIQEEKPEQIVNEGPKIGRNEPCPCGSGKKYKRCCGK